MSDSHPRVARPGELDDLALLPQLFRSFTVEAREHFQAFRDVKAVLERIEDKLGDLARRVTDLEHRHRDTETRLKALEGAHHRKARK